MIVAGAVTWWFTRSLWISAPGGVLTGLVIAFVLVRAANRPPPGNPNDPKPPRVTY